jgi:recombination protein RecT
MSVFKSVVVLAQMGLEIGIDGQAYLVPYKGECTPVPGWKGYVHLVNNAGKATVWTGAVFEGDKFDFQLGDEPYCRHQPTGQVDETKANLRFVYAIGKLAATGEKVIEVWPVAKVLRHLKRFNKVGDKHYALKDDNNFIAYARKVALLQVVKYLPKSVDDRRLEAAQAIEAHGSSAVDLKDVIDGDWTNVTADAGEPDTGGTAEDHTEAGDTTLGQAAETLAREEAETKPDTASPAVDAATTASPGTAAPAASPSETKPKRQRRVID